MGVREGGLDKEGDGGWEEEAGGGYEEMGDGVTCEGVVRAGGRSFLEVMYTQKYQCSDPQLY